MVIGGGAAGLRAAIAARDNHARTILVSKSPVALGNNTALSNAAFAAATGERDARDNPQVHAADTLRAGGYLNNPLLVNTMTKMIVEQVPFLVNCGVSLEKRGDQFFIMHLPGHTHPRHYLCHQPLGTALSLPLKDCASRIGVNFMDKVFISRLIVSDGKASGAIGFDRTGRILVFQAPAVILATGGMGAAFLNTNNATGSTGDGQVLAFHHGIALQDMEFIQFYPTAINGIRMLEYEIFVFRYGGKLYNSQGEDIIELYGLNQPLAMTRDRLSQAIMKEVLAGRGIAGGVTMDLDPVPIHKMNKVRHLLPPNISETERQFIVSPTTHFTMGGIVTNDLGHTSIPGILACGEVVGGTHGANRLIGNALSECIALGAAAGNQASRLSRETPLPKPHYDDISTEKVRLESVMGKGRGDVAQLRRRLREVMWLQAGVVRQGNGLLEALDNINKISALASSIGAGDIIGLVRRLELDNLILSAKFIIRAALERTESRGSHHREDYPQEVTNWQCNLRITRSDGDIIIDKTPVPY